MPLVFVLQPGVKVKEKPLWPTFCCVETSLIPPSESQQYIKANLGHSMLCDGFLGSTIQNYFFLLFCFFFVNTYQCLLSCKMLLSAAASLPRSWALERRIVFCSFLHFFQPNTVPSYYCTDSLVSGIFRALWEFYSSVYWFISFSILQLNLF